MNDILVIDDSDDVRALIVTTLGCYGFSTREAVDGPTGIRLALEKHPDVIVCDVNMPGMDGFRTLSSIRDYPPIASIPFIFLTGSQDKQAFRRGMGSGADDFLTKPFQAEDLLEAVTTRLARQEELKYEIYRRAEKLSCDMASLLSAKLSGPIHGIMGASDALMRECSQHLTPERVLENARHIKESATRLSALAQTMTTN